MLASKLLEPRTCKVLGVDDRQSCGRLRTDLSTLPKKAGQGRYDRRGMAGYRAARSAPCGNRGFPG